MRWVELDARAGTVRFARPGLMLDLGAIGKGYAVDVAVARLQEAGVTSALVHGGTSTVFALGRPPGGEPWKVAVELPSRAPDVAPRILAIVPIENESLSVSAVWGKSFQSGTRECGHVMDPRTGEPVSHTQLSAVVLPSATESDAFSTALLALGAGEASIVSVARPGLRGLVVDAGSSGSAVVRAIGGLEIM